MILDLIINNVISRQKGSWSGRLTRGVSIMGWVDEVVRKGIVKSVLVDHESDEDTQNCADYFLWSPYNLLFVLA